jgi:uncharacterized RDD family membrane protein YckC
VIFAVVQFLFGALFRHTGALAVHFTVHMSNGSVRHDTISFLAILLSGVVAVAYATTLCGGPRGQTVGMMAVGVRVVREATGGPLGYPAAFGRAVLQLLMGYTGILGLLDLLFPLWDTKRQTIHDKAVGSVVLRLRSMG